MNFHERGCCGTLEGSQHRINCPRSRRRGKEQNSTEKATRTIKAAAVCLHELVLSVAQDDENCTCMQQSWYGNGHAAGCIQGDALDIIASIRP